MKKILVIFSLIIFTQICFGQTKFSMNQGGATQTNYYSTIPYKSINEKIIVQVTIKGKQYRFIFDTGAPTTISAKLFDELNPSIITKLSVSDANEAKDSLSIVSLNEITIEEITFAGIPTVVAKQNLFFDCFQADGFIGSNLLRNSLVQLNESTKNIIITNDETKLSLNPKQSSELFLDNQSSPVIWVKLKNREKAKAQLLFDTGMNGLYDLSLRHFNVFQKYNIFEILGKAKGSSSIGFYGVAKDTTHYRLRLPIMEINGAKLINISTQTTTDNNSRIGSKLLEYGITTIDYKNKKFYFNPFFKTEKDVSEKLFPINFIPCNNQLCVGFVWDDTLNEKIDIGDQITAIDGIDYENINICDLLTKESVFKNKDKLVLTTKNKKGEKTETIIERK